MGHVVDAKTGEHLAGITIAIKGSTYGTATDATGHYFLKNLKQKHLTLVMRGLGYLSQERSITIQPGKTILGELVFVASLPKGERTVVLRRAHRKGSYRGD